MGYYFQKRDEINQLIDKYNETATELKNIKNKKDKNIGLICSFILLIILYVGFYFWGQAVLLDSHSMCGGPTDALDNTTM